MVLASNLPGFRQVSLDGAVVDIDFDGESQLIRHQFNQHRVAIEPEGSAGFHAPYIATRLDHGDIIVHFTKKSPLLEAITLILPAVGTSVLASCHRIDNTHRSRRQDLKVLRGSTAGTLSYADLIAFPLLVPPATEVTLTFADATESMKAMFTGAGHLRAWRMSRGPGSTQASGRMLAVNPHTAALPWVAKRSGGTLILDRNHRTFWGVDTSLLNFEANDASIVVGNIESWLG